jgi:hypothetical protein
MFNVQKITLQSALVSVPVPTYQNAKTVLYKKKIKNYSLK